MTKSVVMSRSGEARSFSAAYLNQARILSAKDAKRRALRQAREWRLAADFRGFKHPDNATDRIIAAYVAEERAKRAAQIAQAA